MRKIYKHGGSLSIAIPRGMCLALGFKRADWVELDIIGFEQNDKSVPTIIIQKCQAISVK